VDGSCRASLSAFTALGAYFHLKNPRIREMRDQVEGSFLGIVFLEQVQGTGNQASPAAGTLRAICIKAHVSLLKRDG